MNRKQYILLFVLAPLVLGFCIYLVCDRQIIVIEFLGKILGYKETASVTVESGLLLFIRNYLCDFLWAFALTQVVLLILGPQKRSIVLSLIISLLFESTIELLQNTALIQGTFDLLDIAIETLATVIATFIFTNNNFKHKRRTAV